MIRLSILLSLLLGGTVAAEMKTREGTTHIIIHHSTTESGNAEIFRRYHKQRGWNDIGYHFVITNGNGGIDGGIEKGRDITKVGAHAKGRNHNSIGICLVGKDAFTESQQETTISLLAELCLKYGIKPSQQTIQRHHGECPGNGLNLKEIIEEVGKKL